MALSVKRKGATTRLREWLRHVHQYISNLDQIPFPQYTEAYPQLIFQSVGRFQRRGIPFFHPIGTLYLTNVPHGHLLPTISICPPKVHIGTKLEPTTSWVMFSIDTQRKTSYTFAPKKGVHINSITNRLERVTNLQTGVPLHTRMFQSRNIWYNEPSNRSKYSPCGRRNDDNEVPAEPGP